MQITQTIYLVLFYAFMMATQILVLNKVQLNTTFLKKKIELSKSSSLAIVLFVILILLILLYQYLHTDYLSQTLYFFSSLFLINGFISIFMIWDTKSTIFRILVSSIIVSLLLSSALSFESMILKNILTAVSFLWIAPFFYKQLTISKVYILIFFVVFTIVDFYNIFLVEPIFITQYYSVFLNGFVEFGSNALGVGDFLLSYLAIGFIWLHKGNKGAVLLTVIISLSLLAASLIGFEYSIPFSIFIVIPMFIVYYCSVTKRYPKP